MNDRSAVVSGITVEQDDYTKVTSVRGPSITEPNQTGYIQWGTKDYYLLKVNDKIILRLKDTSRGGHTIIVLR